MHTGVVAEAAVMTALHAVLSSNAVTALQAAASAGTDVVAFSVHDGPGHVLPFSFSYT